MNMRPNLHKLPRDDCCSS